MIVLSKYVNRKKNSDKLCFTMIFKKLPVALLLNSSALHFVHIEMEWIMDIEEKLNGIIIISKE